MRKIIVLGAGAIGSSYGALLSQKHDVTLIGRKQFVERVNKKGLQIKGDINKTYIIRADIQIRKIDPDTLILLCVKVQDTEDAVRQIQKLITKDTVIVCVQNGLHPENIVRKLVTCRVARAVTTMSSVSISKEYVEITNVGQTFLDKRDQDLVSVFETADLPTKVLDIKQKIWEKLTVNCVLNGLGAVLGVNNNKLGSEYLKPTITALVDEIIAVARKEGVTLPNSLLSNIMTAINNSTNTSSTLQDLIKGKKTEVDYLNGEIVKLGKKHGVQIPVNQTVWSLIKTKENL